MSVSLNHWWRLLLNINYWWRLLWKTIKITIIIETIIILLFAVVIRKITAFHESYACTTADISPQRKKPLRQSTKFLHVVCVCAHVYSRVIWAWDQVLQLTGLTKNGDFRRFQIAESSSGCRQDPWNDWKINTAQARAPPTCDICSDLWEIWSSWRMKTVCVCVLSWKIHPGAWRVHVHKVHRKDSTEAGSQSWDFCVTKLDVGNTTYSSVRSERDEKILYGRLIIWFVDSRLNWSDVSCNI